jgi:hypothetical protein
VHFGIVIVLNLVIGALTPPLGVLVFTTARVGGADQGATFRAVIPFVLVMIVVLMLITNVPALTMLPVMVRALSVSDDTDWRDDMSRTRIGIVGLGMAVTPHARGLVDLADSVEVVHAFSPSAARRRRSASGFPFRCDSSRPSSRTTASRRCWSSPRPTRICDIAGLRARPASTC